METSGLKSLIAGIVMALVSSSAWAANDISLGKAEYNAKCAVCHGLTGNGDGPFSSQLAVRSTDLTQLTKNNKGEFPATRILMALDGRSEVQGHGPRDMPVYGEVYLAQGPKGATAKEKEPYVSARLNALIAYLETIQSTGSVDTTALAMGKAEYQAKCEVCHGANGKGDGPFSSQLAVRSTDLTELTKNNKGVFPATRIFMALDGRSEVQGHGPRDMPVYGEVYLAQGPKGATAKEKEPYVNARLNALITYLETIQN